MNPLPWIFLWTTIVYGGSTGVAVTDHSERLADEGACRQMMKDHNNAGSIPRDGYPAIFVIERSSCTYDGLQIGKVNP